MMSRARRQALPCRTKARLPGRAARAGLGSARGAGRAPVRLELKGPRHQVHEQRKHLPAPARRVGAHAPHAARGRTRVGASGRAAWSGASEHRPRTSGRSRHEWCERGARASSSGAEINWNSMNAMTAGRASRKPNDANSAGDVRTAANSENDSSRCACISAMLRTVWPSFQCPARAGPGGGGGRRQGAPGHGRASSWTVAC